MSRESISVNGTKEFVAFYSSLIESSPIKKKLDDVMNQLKKKPIMGDRIQIRLFPVKYVRKYGIRNLYRCPLGSNYRMLYTLVSKHDAIYCVILEVLTHKEYDVLFGYKTS
jgi:mRNA-degrading endonuclease HigB of HigAB toxin-antitoxin module